MQGLSTVDCFDRHPIALEISVRKVLLFHSSSFIIFISDQLTVPVCIHLGLSTPKLIYQH